MNYINFKKSFEDYLIFSLTDIKKNDRRFDRRRLSEWQNKKYLIKLKRGYYIFSDSKISEQELYYIANKIYAPSYISFEMALAFYGLIPESTYGVTSATTKKTAELSTPIGYFIYRTLKKELMFGFNLQKVANKYYKIADLEKTILDHLYINNHLEHKKDFESLRLDSKKLLSKIDTVKMNKYLQYFDNKALSNRYNQLWRHLKDA